MRDLKHGLLLALCSLKHLILARISVAGKVSDVGNIHNAVDLITAVGEVFFKHVLHNIGAKISDVSKVINRRSAGIHADLSLLAGLEFFSCSGK